MLAHSGIILFKKVNRTAGLHFYAGLSPYEFPRTLFNFLIQLKDSRFKDSFNNYFDNISIVPFKSVINQIDKQMLTKANENCTWKDLSDLYTNYESVLANTLFSASFTELPDVSSLIVDIDDSEISHINHIYTIDLDENSISHHIGGIGFNFERSLSYKELIENITDDEEVFLKDSLSKYSELLKNKYGTIE